MNMPTVREINEMYKMKNEAEGHTNQETIEVCNLSDEIIKLHTQAYEKADELVFNDIIEMLNRRVRELEALMETI